jgi:hypothetical protein
MDNRKLSETKIRGNGRVREHQKFILTEIVGPWITERNDRHIHTSNVNFISN